MRFNSRYAMRGKLGRYLSAFIEVDSSSSGNVAFNLGADGQGIGELVDCLVFINTDHKEDNGPVKYGATVAIKSPAAKERLLGIRDGARIGFWRHLIGQGEKWQLLKAANNVGASTGYRGLEEMGSRGQYVRVGDSVLLQTYRSDNLLSLNETVTGAEVRLVYKDRTGLNTVIWQIEQFGCVALPQWYFNRPYLSGRYLTIPQTLKSTAPDIEARTFPRLSASALQNKVLDPQFQPLPCPELNSMPPTDQQVVLLRELLQVMSGVEGQHIRVSAAGTLDREEFTQADLRGSASSKVNSKTPGSTTATSSKFHSLKVKDVFFMIDSDRADKSLANQVNSILPICESAIRVREFLKLHSKYEFGLVSHALCAAIKKIMREFDVLIAQLEQLLLTSRLTLQKFIYLLQPSKATLRVLEKLCCRVANLIGGQLLDAIYVCLLEQGDAKARELHLHLLMQASKPFLKMLGSWIYRGELHDPYKEFMVLEDFSLAKEALEEDFNAQYWDHHYSLSDKHIPMLFRDHAKKALITGKYLNVIRQCVGSTNKKAVVPFYEEQEDALPFFNDTANADLPVERELILTTDLTDHSIAEAIEDAYVFSSRALLKMLNDEHQLRSHFQSLRRFFLLEHGDFFIQFMDTAEHELLHDVQDVVVSRVHMLLQMSIQTSTLAADPNKEELTCILAQHNLIQHLNLIQSAGENVAPNYANSQGLKGVEAFTLDYRVGWPLSIVLSRRSITKYQLLSRLLYFSKHVERRLLCSWQTHQQSKQLNVRNFLGLAYCVRHKMLHFLQNFVYYMTLEVINPRSHEFQEAMAEARDMDEVMELHEKFLDACLKECLLASQDLLKILTKLMTTCILFADKMHKVAVEEENNAKAIEAAQEKLGGKRKSRGLDGSQHSLKSFKDSSMLQQMQQNRQRKMRLQADFIEKEATHESFIRILTKFSDTFDQQLKEFLDKLWTDSYRHHVQLSNLCVRLDYNGFYSSEFTNNP